MMESRLTTRRTTQLIAVLLGGLALKYFYSTASVNELRWILAPTTLAVELITKQRFYFEPYAGYINSNHTFVIAASCAGVNFLLTAFLMLSLTRLWRERATLVSWRFFPAAALVAYFTTIITNTIRISIAMHLRETQVASSWLSAGQVHRLEGIFVYFGFLLLLYVLSERLSDSADGRASSVPRSEKFAGRARFPSVRRAFFPLSIYYVTTLGIPLANGAFRENDFWEHSIFVLVIPLTFILPLGVFRFLRNTSLINKVIGLMPNPPNVRALKTP